MADVVCRLFKFTAANRSARTSIRSYDNNTHHAIYDTLYTVTGVEVVARVEWRWCFRCRRLVV